MMTLDTVQCERTESRHLNPIEEARAHLFALYRGGLLTGEWYELRCLNCSTTPARPGPRSFHRSITDLCETAIPLRDQWDVFVGVGLRRCPDAVDMRHCRHTERGKDHISRLPAVWADIDIQSDAEAGKPHASLDDVLGMLHEQPVPPNIIVGSGVGVHAYWTFAEPTSELARVEAINRSIRARVSGDNAIDAARILRLSGTFNHKHGRPLPVRLLHVAERQP